VKVQSPSESQDLSAATGNTAIAQTTPLPVTPKYSQLPKPAKKAKINPIGREFLFNTSDPYTPVLSPEAIQLAELLHVTDKLKQIQRVQQQPSDPNAQTLSIDQRQNLAESKLELLQTIEQIRLEIDFVASAIEVEEAALEEILQSYTTERDR